jgi:ABC-type branched-subunit amino acid transport system substrate-binding protein
MRTTLPIASLVATLTLLILTVGFYPADACRALPQTKPVIGVLASYTGDWGAYGQAYRRGIELAGVEDRATFVFEEDGFLPAKTVTAFRKLLEVDKISAVLVGDTVTAQAIAPIALQSHIPLIAWASDDGVFRNNPLALRLWSSRERDIGFISSEISRRGYKRLALFTSTHTYTAAWGANLKARFPGSEWQDFSSPPESFQTYLLKAKQRGFDAIGVCLSSGLNGRLAKQMKQLQISLPLFGCNFLEASADIVAAAGSLDGVWFTAPKISPDFANRYRNSTGITDHVVSAAIFHDAALLATKTTDKPFAIANLKEVAVHGDRYLEFDYQVLRFSGSEIVAE